MTRDDPIPCLEALDLHDVARILTSVFPHFSLCQCARMAAEFAPAQGSVCSLCAPGVYPDCVRHEQPGDALTG